MIETFYAPTRATSKMGMTVSIAHRKAKGEPPYPVAHIYSVNNVSLLKGIKGPVNTNSVESYWCDCL